MSGVSYLVSFDESEERSNIRRVGRKILRAAVSNSPKKGQGVNGDNSGNFAAGWRIAYQWKQDRFRIFNNVDYAGFVEGGAPSNQFYKNVIRDIIRREVANKRSLVKVGRRSYRSRL